MYEPVAVMIWETSSVSLRKKKKKKRERQNREWRTITFKKLNGHRNAGSLLHEAAQRLAAFAACHYAIRSPPVIDSLMTQSRESAARFAPVFTYTSRSLVPGEFLINDLPSLSTIGRLSKLNGRLSRKSRSHDLWVFPANHRMYVQEGNSYN